MDPNETNEMSTYVGFKTGRMIRSELLEIEKSIDELNKKIEEKLDEARKLLPEYTEIKTINKKVERLEAALNALQRHCDHKGQKYKEDGVWMCARCGYAV